MGTDAQCESALRSVGELAVTIKALTVRSVTVTRRHCMHPPPPPHPTPEDAAVSRKNNALLSTVRSGRGQVNR